jgi:hypothetical protein
VNVARTEHRDELVHMPCVDEVVKVRLVNHVVSEAGRRGVEPAVGGHVDQRHEWNEVM